PEILDGKLGDVTCRHHQPDDARLRQSTRERDDRFRGLDDPLLRERSPGGRIRVEADHLDAAASKATRHVAAHAAQTDDADLHAGSDSGGKARCYRFGCRQPTVARLARCVAVTAAATISAPPASVRALGTSPSSANASAIP